MQQGINFRIAGFLNGFLFLVSYTTADPVHNKCNGVVFNNEYYDKEVLVQSIESLGQFSIDKKNDILLHSYLEDDNIKVGYVNLGTKEFGEIKAGEAGFATAYDDVNEVAYIGSEDGIYTFNPSTKTAQFYGARHTNIWSLFICKQLYFADYPSNNIYDYNSGNPKRVNAFKSNFVKHAICDEKEIFFVNETGLYSGKMDFEVTDILSTDDAYRFISKDNYGDIYVVGRWVAANDVRVEIYKINKKEKNIEKVALIEETISAMAFDRHNNIIYNEASQIVILKHSPQDKECLQFHKSTN